VEALRRISPPLPPEADGDAIHAAARSMATKGDCITRVPQRRKASCADRSREDVPTPPPLRPPRPPPPDEEEEGGITPVEGLRRMVEEEEEGNASVQVTQKECMNK
jgi:hypothetical protein